MKNTTVTLALLATLTLPALVRADIVLVQDTLLQGASSRTTMSIKGNKVRTDNGTDSTVIMNTDTGEMTTLMHEQKMAVTVNMKQLQAASTPASPQGEAPEMPKITKTGQKETVDGYECDIYLSELKGMVVKMWMARDYPGLDKLKAELKTMEKMAASPAPKSDEVPGMMIKSEFEQSGLKFTTKLISLESKPLSDDLFVVPAGYQPVGQ